VVRPRVSLVDQMRQAPPQLWRLDRVGDDVRLSLRHTYMPSADVDFAGTSYFGGKDDQLIVCGGKSTSSGHLSRLGCAVRCVLRLRGLRADGHIHIWDRESATLLHDLRAPDGDLTGIAWNTGSETPMFATGSHDGAVKIWTSTLQQPLVDESRSASGPGSPSGIPSRSESPGGLYVESPKEMVGNPVSTEASTRGRKRDSEPTTATSPLSFTLNNETR
jgi:WD repeat-containing protein 26